MRFLSPDQTKGMISVAAKPPGARAATSMSLHRIKNFRGLTVSPRLETEA
jgi:hypothetical protein